MNADKRGYFKGEWRWPMLFAALVMALTLAPYGVAFARQTPEWRFSGFLFGIEDGNSYLANMEQGAHGAWLFTLPYSSEPQSGALIYLFYLLLGKLAGPEHTAQVMVFHAARLVLGWVLLWVSYLFLAEFLPRVKQRRLALVWVALGGGFGWALILLGQGNLFGSLPIDFISPEAYTFLDLYGLPHLAAARCLFLLGLLAWARGRSGWAGLALLGVSLIQPLYVLVAWGVMSVDCWGEVFTPWPRVWKRPSGRRKCFARIAKLRIAALMLTGLISCPIVVYTVVVFSVDPVLRQWNAQNILPSPHPLHYLLGYGVYLGLGALGWRVLAHRSGRLARLVGGWLVLALFLLYAPIPTQRRLIEGVQLPLVVLAVFALTVVLRRWRRWLLPLCLALTLPTTALLWLSGLFGTLRPAMPVYHSADQVAVFDWLAREARPGEVTLSAYEIGNILPAYAPLVAYIGHGPETVGLAQKKPRVAAFYSAARDEAARRQLLAEGRIRYVLVGPPERALGAFDPARADYLERVFAAGDYELYRVR